MKKRWIFHTIQNETTFLNQEKSLRGKYKFKYQQQRLSKTCVLNVFLMMHVPICSSRMTQHYLDDSGELDCSDSNTIKTHCF